MKWQQILFITKVCMIFNYSFLFTNAIRGIISTKYVCVTFFQVLHKWDIIFWDIAYFNNKAALNSVSYSSRQYHQRKTFPVK
jgi:hypothetical protein